MSGNPSHDLLAALRTTPAVQRLRRVSQAGAPCLFRSTRSVTRYEHSVGVATLAARLDLPLAAQVTALLHDTTHSAFSHTLDYLVANTNEDTHEHAAHRLLTNPELAALLDTATLAHVVEAISTKPTWLRVLDAVDYTLRDLCRAGLLTHQTARAVTADLTTTDAGAVCFTTTTGAWAIVRLMATANSELYMDTTDLYRHARLAELLAAGIERGALTLDDIMTGTDHDTLTRLRSDPHLSRRIDDFRNTNSSQLRERRDRRRITSMSRLLDPPVRVSPTEAVPLSVLDPCWQKDNDAARRRAEAGVRLLTAT